MFMKFKPFIGPKEYKFQDPDLPHKVYNSATKEDLIRQIESFRTQNRLEPILRLSDTIDNYLCSLPENTGSCEAAKMINRSFLTYVKGGVALLKHIFGPGSFNTPQAVAEKRASICIDCKYNVFPDKKGFVKWSDHVAEQTTNGRTTTLHSYLGNCEVCTCVLKAKVFYSGSDKFTKEQTEKMKSVGCWQVSNR